MEPEPRPEPITEPKVLLVEGPDERGLFSEFAKHLALSQVQIQPYRGKDNLGRFLRVLASTSGFSNVTSLVVVRDADDNAGGAFQSVCDCLRSARLPVPSVVLQSTTMTSPRVMAAILPTGRGNGCLEDVLLGSVDGDPAITCVDQYIRCLSGAGATPKQVAKARIHAYLASREKPGLRIGEAAQAGYWPWERLQALEHILRLL